MGIVTDTSKPAAVRAKKDCEFLWDGIQYNLKKGEIRLFNYHDAMTLTKRWFKFLEFVQAERVQVTDEPYRIMTRAEMLAREMGRTVETPAPEEVVIEGEAV